MLSMSYTQECLQNVGIVALQPSPSDVSALKTSCTAEQDARPWDLPLCSPRRNSSAHAVELHVAKQGGRWLAGYLVGALAGVDRWLEARGALASLDRPETDREAQQRDISDTLSKEVAATPELPPVHVELREGAPLQCPHCGHGWSPTDATGS